MRSLFLAIRVVAPSGALPMSTLSKSRLPEDARLTKGINDAVRQCLEELAEGNEKLLLTRREILEMRRDERDVEACGDAINNIVMRSHDSGWRDRMRGLVDKSSEEEGEERSGEKGAGSIAEGVKSIMRGVIGRDESRSPLCQAMEVDDEEEEQEQEQEEEEEGEEKEGDEESREKEEEREEGVNAKKARLNGGG
jgi:hypothetical protein